MSKKLSNKIKSLPQKPGIYPHTLKKNPSNSRPNNAKRLFFRNKVSKLPKGVGVYMFQDKSGRILYIGKATNLRNRVRSHFAKQDNSPQPPLILRGGIENVADIDWIQTDDEKQALLLENDLIKKYKPRYNIQWRDDKSYFWVALSNDEWPRVEIVHFKKLRTKNYELKTEPIGPFINGRELRQLLRALRKIFPYRTCKNSYNKPCLQWHIGLCPAHNGKLHIAYSKSLNTYKNSLNAFAQFLKLYAGEPIRIEAYDISNIHGVWATGSMIVFDGAKPKKSDYRRFKIKTVQGANDVAMIKEVIKRRFGHPEWPSPDLILIDGGRAQLSAALQIARLASQAKRANRISRIVKKSSRLAISDKRLAVVALAKREEEIYTEYSAKILKLSALPTEMKLVFQTIRNEAHRFAIFYYRHLHRRTIKTK